MINPKIEQAINAQINAEMYSAYLYMSMSTYLDTVPLPGFANWMRVQAQEELTHAVRLHNYLRERGGRVLLTAIEAPPTEWDSPLAVAEAVAAHEAKVTGLINDLVDLAMAEKDHATYNFLQWFVAEQVEEEAGADELVGQFKMAEGARGAMFMLDKQLAGRAFTPPADLAT